MSENSSNTTPETTKNSDKSITENPAVAGLIDQLEEKSTLTYSKNSVVFSNMNLSADDFSNLKFFSGNDNMISLNDLTIYKLDADTNEKKPVSKYIIYMFERVLKFKINKHIRKKKLENFESNNNNFSFTLNEAGVKIPDLDVITGLTGDSSAANKSKGGNSTYEVSGMTCQIINNVSKCPNMFTCTIKEFGGGITCCGNKGHDGVCMCMNYYV